MADTADEETRDPYIERFHSSPVSLVTRGVIDAAFRAYQTARYLSLTAFVVGIGLVITGVAFSFRRDDSALLSLILGGLGTVNVVALLLYRPIERIQLGVNELVRSQIVWLTFQAQYDFVARALATLSELPIRSKDRGWDEQEGLRHELQLSQRLGDFASELIVTLGGQLPSASIMDMDGGND